MTDAHTVSQPIVKTQIPSDDRGNPIDYVVGRNCTRIEACAKDGEYSLIPYLRVWDGDVCLAEFSQHKAEYVLFGRPPTLPREDEG